MNPILELKGGMRPVKNPNGGGGVSFPKDFSFVVSKLERLIERLELVRKYWSVSRGIDKALVNIHYKRVVPKTGRVSVLFKERDKTQAETIRGGRFETCQDDNGQSYHRHVFTHYIEVETIAKTLKVLTDFRDNLNAHFAAGVTYRNTVEIGEGKLEVAPYSKTTFLKILKDVDSVADFDVPHDTTEFREESVVSIYDLGTDTKQLMLKFGVEVEESRIYNKTTLRLTVDEIQKLQKNAPYLISMGFSDVNEIPPVDEQDAQRQTPIAEDDSYPIPNGEPVVGVIDTQFDETVHFHKWVKFENRIANSAFEFDHEDSAHGTGVSFIIVDGPSLNPELEDGCGKFQVRHFGVATKHGFRSFEIMQEIRKIVAANRDIKVWNLSLGTNTETQENFISPSAAELDALQHEYDDIIFVVAGTNKRPEDGDREKRMGSPADSLNSIVVNSVTMDRRPASYTRVGPVLSFFHKPDVAYYGGDGQLSDERIRVYNGGLLPVTVKGTSFAAPWIARKVAYLIHIMGFTREVAKALLLDSAAGWESLEHVKEMGYGIVPRRIEDIVSSKDDEIKFFIFGRAEAYEMRAYNLPVPLQDGAFPFYARATLSYFPYCNRNQGVDYTCTEMDIRLGRLKKNKNGEYTVSDIKGNRQGEEKSTSNLEENARSELRKWDNVKRSCEAIPEKRKIARGRFDSDFWGLRVITKERVSDGRRNDLAYGVVVTLKEINGNNRIEAFEDACLANGWLVNRIDVHERLEIHNRAEEEIELK